ncbi:hypothetical protein P7C73_g28, partial [Tremellales sp. Uapishka_1]
MQRYQPPHLRQRQQPQHGPTRSSRNDLSSPSGDMKPARIRDVAAPSRMEMLASVSRSGGDGKEGDALKDPETQVEFRRYIDERIEKHYQAFPTPRDCPPPRGATDELESLGSIVLLFRKVREGVVASHRHDAFAIEAFESSARMSILAGTRPQLLSALSGLVPGLYGDNRKGKRKATDVSAAMADLSIDSSSETLHTSLLLLYHLVMSPRSTFNSLYLQLATPSPPYAHVLRAVRALAAETFDALAYFALLNDSSLSPYERIILSWAEGDVREQSWERIKKAYMQIGFEWASKLLGMGSKGDEETIQWLKDKGIKVDRGKIGLR